MTTKTVLHAENLDISYKVNEGWVKAVRDFEIEVKAGEIYGIVGESGSGKSTVARGLMRYLPQNGRTEPGSRITFLGEDITDASRDQMRSIWGARMNLVPQDPTAALNPAMKIGKQMAEILKQHTSLSSREVKERVIQALERVNLADAEKITKRFPHEISGGQAQRVTIAMALVTSPQLLILDEPTTALDVTTEAVILNLIRELIKEEDTAAIYVTHNLGVVAQLCERVTVMYAGEIMADGPVHEMFYQPQHPYTVGLLNAIPQPGQTKRQRPLQAIPGRPPSLTELPTGCVYAPRCPLAIEVCEQKPPLEQTAEDRSVRCHRWEELVDGSIEPQTVYAGDEDAIAGYDMGEERDPVLTIEGLTKHFETRRSLVDIVKGRQLAPTRAVDNVNLTVHRGRTYGLVGESGSGKTTLAKVLIGLFDKTAGSIDLLGTDFSVPLEKRDREMLAELQMVFQNPQNSLNPYLTIGQSLRRPLMKLAGLSRDDADKEVQRLLKSVSLRAEYAQRYPNELSGGEKQRVAIARAFASDPALILADEPVSSLDVSVQSAVLNVLAHLQEENQTSYIFISHDLSVVSYLADYIAVMYLGWLMEVGEARDLFTPPLHPYTEALVSAIPVPDPEKRKETVLLGDNIPSAQDVPSGCRFHTRCPHFLGDICVDETPPWQQADEGHYYRCHITPDDLREIQADNPVFTRIDKGEEA